LVLYHQSGALDSQTETLGMVSYINKLSTKDNELDGMCLSDFIIISFSYLVDRPVDQINKIIDPDSDVTSSDNPFHSCESGHSLMGG